MYPFPGGKPPGCQIEALDHVPLHLFVDNASGGSLFAKKQTRPK